MSDGSAQPGAQPEQLAELLAQVWSHIVGHVNALIHAHERFGFVRFEENLNPTLDDVLRGLVVVDFALTQFLDSDILEYEEKRNVLNSKQCILHMKQLGAALQSGQKEEYERIIATLKSQPKF